VGINLKDDNQQFNLYVYEFTPFNPVYTEQELGIILIAQERVRDRGFKYPFSDKYRKLLDNLFYKQKQYFLK